MLQEGDRQLFERALERAALCGEGAILRLLASQSALSPREKKGYTPDEVRAIARVAREYARLAEAKQVFLAMEHARDPLYGDGATYFGIHDIFENLENSGGVPTNLGVTFDPANAVFSPLCKAPTTPDKVLEFLSEHNQYVAMVHYKTAAGGELPPSITDGDIDDEQLFSLLSRFYDGIVCLEIPPARDLAACRKNIEASLEYLRSTGLMGYFAQKGKT